MKTIKKNDPDAIEQAVQLLSQNKVIIAPGDTIYGILGAVPGTKNRIREIKGREETKPFLILSATVEDAERFCGIPIDIDLIRYWPGPLTLILNSKSGESIGIRVPNDPFLHRVLGDLGRPVYSTSVNRAGDPPMNTIDEIISQFKDETDLIIDAGDMPKRHPSTIVDTTQIPFRVIRRGGLHIDEQDLYPKH